MGCCASTRSHQGTAAGAGATALPPAVATEVDAHVQGIIRASEPLRVALPLLVRLRRGQKPAAAATEAFIAQIRADDMKFAALPGASSSLRLSPHSMRSLCELLRQEARCSEGCTKAVFDRFTAWAKQCGGEERVLRAIDVKFDLELHRVIFAAVERHDARVKSGIKGTPVSPSEAAGDAPPAPPPPPPPPPVTTTSAAAAATTQPPTPSASPAEVTVHVAPTPSVPELALEAPAKSSTATSPTTSNVASMPTSVTGRASDPEPALLPPGEWKRCPQNPQFFYSKAEDLFFHPATGWSYDSKSGMWFDPDTNRWVEDAPSEAGENVSPTAASS